MPILMNDQLAVSKITLESLSASLLSEASLFFDHAKTQQTSALLPRFKNYRKFVRENRRRVRPDVLLKSLVEQDGIIHAANQSLLLSDILVTAQLAACCELFDGWVIKEANLFLEQDFKEFIERNLSGLRGTSERRLAIEYDKFSRADTIRVMQILNLLGLCGLSAHNRILSIGSGQGQRELNATHVVPKISLAAEKPGGLGKFFRFSRKVTQPDHMVLIDSDPFWQEPYRQLNAQMPNLACAINDSWENALLLVDKGIRDKNMEAPNLVVLWRIEHEAFRDVAGFFQLLSRFVSEGADLIITIGAGNSIEEFKARRDKLKEFINWLADRGLKPRQIVLHNGSRLAPIFGDLRYASYEILYCRLDSSRMLNA